MTTEKALDQMMELLPLITPILDDPEATEIRKMVRPKKEGERSECSTCDLMNKLFPMIVSRHRPELYGILAHLKGVAPEEVKDVPFEEIKAVLQGGILKDFFDFFPFLLQMALRV